MRGTIPKRIIQTGKIRDLPLLERAAEANIRLLNPDFEYVFFDDVEVEEFIDAKFPEYRTIFDAFPIRIQRYDFFRYLAVYEYGGFYFDLDVLLACGLDDLLEFGCVFPFEELTVQRFLRQEYGMDWEIGNYAFGATPRHPFVGAIIDNCVKAQRDPSWVEAMLKPIPRIFREEFSVFDTTGPGLVSRTLAEYPEAANEVKVLFPEDVCDSRTWHRFGSYGVHLQEGGWRKRKSLLRRRLTAHWETSTRGRLLKESLKRGPTRSLEFTRD
jgi:hypothetical protein